MREEIFKTSDGCSLQVFRSLPTARLGSPRAVFLHGFPEDASCWFEIMNTLAAAGIETLAPNQRGYAKSSKPKVRRSYSLRNLLNDLDALTKDSEPFFLVGHDWGGLVAWSFAALYPERVRKLVILNAPHPSAFKGYLRSHLSQIKKSAYIAFFQLPWLPEKRLRRVHFRFLRETLLKTSRPGTYSAPVLAAYVKNWGRRGSLTAMLNWYRAIPLSKDIVAGARVKCETLILWGARDRFLERGLAEASTEFCDKSKIVYFEDATHWLPSEEPARVSEELLHFFLSFSSRDVL